MLKEEIPNGEIVKLILAMFDVFHKFCVNKTSSIKAYFTNRNILAFERDLLKK